MNAPVLSWWWYPPSSYWMNVNFRSIWHSRPQSLLGAWARGPGGSGDTGFEVLDFRTSGHFRFKSKLEDSLLKALNHLNLQSLTLLQEQMKAIRNVVENQKWPEVLKSRTSKPLSPEPPGPCAQALRRLWGREWAFGTMFVWFFDSLTHHF